jgi:hypothetical protein
LFNPADKPSHVRLAIPRTISLRHGDLVDRVAGIALKQEVSTNISAEEMQRYGQIELRINIWLDTGLRSRPMGELNSPDAPVVALSKSLIG